MNKNITYALYKKIPNGMVTDIEIIAVSDSKEKLMAQLPYEVANYLRARGNDDYEIFAYSLPTRYKPREFWARGPFDAEEFRVVSTARL